MAYPELEERAAAALAPSVLSYVAGGAGSEHTQRANARAFHPWGLIPRMFVGAAQRDLTVDLFGLTLPSPLLMAPIGVIGLCAQDRRGDLATAEATARTGVPMIASTLSVDPLEDVAARLLAWSRGDAGGVNGTPAFHGAPDPGISRIVWLLRIFWYLIGYLFLH
jgi:lactate 2-monooxygenase